MPIAKKGRTAARSVRMLQQPSLGTPISSLRRSNGKVGQLVISLKKYMDMNSSELNRHREPSPDELLAVTLDGYRSALGAMGDCGVQTCSALGPDLQRGLMVVAERLAGKVTP